MFGYPKVSKHFLWGIFIFASSCTYNNSSKNTDSERVIVLTFDDAVSSHLTHVAPLLQEYGFGATFFISYAWMADTVNFLKWEEITELYEMGFEIGNHSWTHPDFSQPQNASELSGELGLIEWMLMQHGISKPVSFAYTGNGFGPEAIKILRQEGYKFARRGMQPEIAYGDKRPGPTFIPDKNHPLLIPTTRDGYPNLSFNDYVLAIEKASENEIVILQFHGVPDITHPWVHTSYELFEKVMKYLKDRNFKVIALKDLEPYIPEELPEDSLMQYRHTLQGTPDLIWPLEVNQTRQNMDFWMNNMVNYHQFSYDEIQMVTGYNLNEIDSVLYDLNNRLTVKVPHKKIIVKPYPGGRHPRIGFKDGMRSPMRGTKASAFLPWESSDYIIIDLPEAVSTQFGLTFLGHKHIPTVFDLQRIPVHNQDWEVIDDGALINEWELPNNMTIISEIYPGSNSIDLKLILKNNTSDTVFTNLKTQVCIMFKNASEFNTQTNDNKIFECPVTAIHSADSSKWIITAWDYCVNSWGNEDCPCMHADPVFPDCKPGEAVQLSGKIWFYEGIDVQTKIDIIKKEFLFP
jgi:peptidoglycan/xylan/chitin deacetylase (PgdA/CDA1 family)